MRLADFYLGDVWGFTLAIIGFLLSLQGLWLVCRALWPQRVEAAALRCENNRVASFFAGLGIMFVTILVAVVAGKTLGAPGQGIAYVVLFSLLIFTGIGTSGFVTHIGRRLESPADAASPWRATVRGGVALEFACLIPLLGWFGILPISLIIGCGASALGLFARARQTSQTQAQFTAAPSLPPRIDLPPRASLDLPPLGA